jgi:hypothetical protein
MGAASICRGSSRRAAQRRALNQDHDGDLGLDSLDSDQVGIAPAGWDRTASQPVRSSAFRRSSYRSRLRQAQHVALETRQTSRPSELMQKAVLRNAFVDL